MFQTTNQLHYITLHCIALLTNIHTYIHTYKYIHMKWNLTQPTTMVTVKGVSVKGQFIPDINIYGHFITYIHTYITLHYITVHCITLHYTALHCIATTFHDITLHYIAVHYIAVQYIALH